MTDAPKRHPSLKDASIDRLIVMNDVHTDSDDGHHQRQLKPIQVVYTHGHKQSSEANPPNPP